MGSCCALTKFCAGDGFANPFANAAVVFCGMELDCVWVAAGEGAVCGIYKGVVFDVSGT